MYYKVLITLLILGNILPEPVPLDNFEVIIIPISNTPPRTNYLNQPIKNSRHTSDNFHRIDIESYEEPTEMPDVDNFDYMKEIKAEDREDRDDRGDKDAREDRLDDSFQRKNFIRYLIERTNNEDIKTKKHNLFTRSDDDPFPIADYDEPVYDFDSLYGENKIVGGLEVDINLYPYHVAYGTNCGGAIIDKKWIITAGHCGKKPYIRVGSKYVNQGTKIAVKHSFIHPQWPAKTKEHPFDFDFQLLELAENLKYSDNIQPIKIAHIEDMVIGKVITVTGWGNTKENGPYSSVLRAVRVPIISKENCQHVPFPYFRGGLTARMFCAGFSEGKKDACQGDSGGPAVAYDRLLGMVSFGYGCATPGSYGVYSKVAKVRPWIEETTGLKLE